MDIRQLRYFVAIVEAGSFSKAADLLRVAQPGLSQHVRHMEADLGVELLFRSPQGVCATEAGETLLRQARLILSQIEVAQEMVRDVQAEPQGEVRFGLPGTVSQMLCVPLVSEARRRYPKIKLRVAEAMSGFVLDWLRDGKIDLGVLYRVVTDRELEARHVLSEALSLVGPARRAKSEISETEPPAGPVSFPFVSGLSLILPSIGHGLRDLIEERAKLDEAQLSTVLDLDTYGQIKLLVENGFGYSILPDAAVQLEVQDGRLKRWPMGNPVLSRNLYLVHPRNRPQSSAARAIEELAYTMIVRLVEDGVWPAKLAPSASLSLS